MAIGDCDPKSERRRLAITLTTGGKSPLYWLVILRFAETFGIPPWELAEPKNPLVWIERWIYVTNLKAKTDNGK